MKGGQLLQPEIIVLGVAVVAEAAVLGGVLMGLVRLRARLGSPMLDKAVPSQRPLDTVTAASGYVAGNGGASLVVMEQLDAFVEETGLLGEALVSKLEERLARYDTALAGATDGAALSSRGASIHRVEVPGDNAPEDIAEDEAAEEAPAPVLGARQRSQVDSPARPGTAATIHAREPEPPDPVSIGPWDVFDIQTAREKGMDPLGVALQRSLSARGAREGEARA
jgi:hypothetical protein